ncbi:MAG: glycosyltransferase family 4 protein [Prevotella sp.]
MKKVLIISTYRNAGGAAIAASRLTKALQGRGVETEMMVSRKGVIKGKSMPFVMERMSIFAHNLFSTKHLYAIDTACCGEDILKTEAFRSADVIHLHWINQGMLSLKTIRRIIDSGKRVVWTMHDAWAATGICHLTMGCDHFMRECGDCQYLRLRGAADLSHRVWKKKQALYADHRMTFVTCSRWLRGEAMRSSLLAGQDVRVVPNPIDTAFYAPQDKASSRDALRLPHDKKLLLFVAQSVSNPYKGMDYLVEAIKMTGDEDIELVMLGSRETGISERLEGTRVHAMGYISDPDTIRKAYSAADAFVLPSLSENLPNTIMEAMACGTPCVGFAVGGIPEMIGHKENGYVARYRDAADLAEGLAYVLQNASGLGTRCREKVEKEYSEAAVAEKYIKIYESCVEY